MSSSLKIRKRQSTITQQYSPQFRRRITSNNLSLSLPGQFLTEVSIASSHNNFNNNVNAQTGNINIKQQLLNNDKTIQKSKQLLQFSIKNYNKINDIIDAVDEIIKNRMQAHQVSLLTVVRSQIDKMQQDCKRVVQQYNQMIQEKNKQTQIYHLKNQVDYFRNTAMKYYRENRKLQGENKELRVLVGNKDSVIEELNIALKKVTKKYMKQKLVKNNNLMMMTDLKTCDNLDNNKKQKQQEQQEQQPLQQNLLSSMKMSSIKVVTDKNEQLRNKKMKMQNQNQKTKIKSQFINNSNKNVNALIENDFKLSGDCRQTDQKSNNGNLNLNVNINPKTSMNMTTNMNNNIKKNLFYRYDQSSTFRKVKSHSVRKKLYTETKTSSYGDSILQTHKRLNSGQSKSFWKLTHQN